MLHVDHVIYGTRDIDAAAGRLWEEHGLASVVGGRHRAWGTENRIVPLGDAYLELMTVFDAELAARTQLGRFVAQRIARGDGFLGWMAAGEGFEERAAALGVEPMSFGRQRPDGSEVRWRLAGLETMITQPPLPGLLAWDDPDAFPGHTPVEHPGVTPRGFAWLELAGDEQRLRDWIGEDAGLPLRVLEGDPPGVRAAAIALDDGGEIVIR
ncbi:MAG: VOC family protein [Solirubrobacteraceae bacterium]